MSRAPRPVRPLRRVGLLSPCGYGNLGDAATQDALLWNLRARCPSAEIVGFYLNPADTEERHGIPCFPLYPGYVGPRAASGAEPAQTTAGATASVEGALPAESGSALRRGLKSIPLLYPILRAANAALTRVRTELGFSREAYRQVKGLDLLVMAGGGQVADDWGGAWRQPFTMFRWTMLARLAGVRIAFLSVGTGPLSTRMSRWFARRAMALADYISYRDETSLRFMESIGFHRPGHACHDLAYSLPLPEPTGDDPRERSLISIGPMPYFHPRHWPEKDAAVYRDYVEKLAELIRRMVARGYRIALFSGNIRMDPVVNEELLRLLEPDRLPEGSVVHVTNTEVMQNTELLARSRFVISSRYHGVLLAHRVGTPAIGLSYHPKVRAALEDMGNLEYCLDLPGWTVDEAVALIEAMEATEPELRARIAQRVGACTRDLEQQYDEVFGGPPAESRGRPDRSSTIGAGR